MIPLALTPREMHEEQERFAAYMAHELRTPLATQCALLELALAEPETDVAAWRVIGEEILAACRQQERLLESCLALARGRGTAVRCEPIDLASIAADALRAHDVGELESVVALEPAWTTGDPDLLELLAANLVSNAIRYNIPGGRVAVATRIETEHAVLSVTNTGPPIATDELQRIFQPFQRLDSNPRTFGDGVGLGLAIVHAVADTHEATLTVRAPTGGGLEIDVAFTVLEGLKRVEQRRSPATEPERTAGPTAAAAGPARLRALSGRRS